MKYHIRDIILTWQGLIQTIHNQESRTKVILGSTRVNRDLLSVPDAHLVHVHQLCMWKVERGNEQAHTLALHPVPVQVVRHHPGHKVFSCARPAMEGESQGFVGFGVVDKALDGFQYHRLGQMLPMELQL